MHTKNITKIKNQREKQSSPRPRNPTLLQALLRPPVRPGAHGRHPPPHVFARQFLPESGIHQLRREAVVEDLADVGRAGVGGVEGGDELGVGAACLSLELVEGSMDTRV